MKKIIVLTAFMLFFAGSAWSLYIHDTEFIDVGAKDTLVAYAEQTVIGQPTEENELAWINEVTGSNYVEYTKLEDSSLRIFRTYTDVNVETITQHTFALSFGAATPDYFLLKCGKAVDGDTTGVYTNFLLQNDNGAFNWGVFDLYGYDNFSIFEIDNVSHAGTAGAAPVPEPGTMILLGAGLIGLAGFRRKSARVH